MTLHISPFSGTWYPAQAGNLRRLLDERLAESATRTGAHLPPGALAYIVPHAGPEYSGTVASAVYRSIAIQKPERIVVLAFPHHARLRGVAAPDIESILTPLGDFPLDLRGAGAFPSIDESRVCDHSLEIQLPFLQTVAPRTQVSALYVGRMDAEERAAAAGRLAEGWRPGTVFLASSDFTHYGEAFGYTPFPLNEEVGERIDELDHYCIDAAGSLDAAMFLDAVAERRATICGTGPIALLLEVLRRLPVHSVYQHILDYQTSGDRTGDFAHTVSYAAIGYYPMASFDLDDADRRALLDSAHATLDQLRRTGKRKSVPACGSPALDVPRGMFVSLHAGEELLGCVGNSEGRMPLREEVSQLTLASALDDSRFERPATAIGGDIEIEISLLTPLRRVREISVFQPGVHGAMMRIGSRCGLLLPQVASGHGWNAEEFWRALARKSMLGPNAWRDPAVRIHLFEAQIFSRSKKHTG